MLTWGYLQRDNGGDTMQSVPHVEKVYSFDLAYLETLHRPPVPAA
jgi:hypothetical protein